MQTTLPASRCSVVKLFEKLEAFKSCSGLELNRSKTEAMWLGKNNPQPTNLFGINWPSKCVCLGVCFFCDSKISVKDDFKKRLLALVIKRSHTLRENKHCQKFSSFKYSFYCLGSECTQWFC